ncbi:hypothetical protein BJV78DRAFT_1135515 [Lactifluus subvellereus]|nr:hypothetical protein BJV78DRAFT_1135515 [Lactifluus subvellereus]
MDYLPIQASAVPCKRVFSSSAEMDTKKRNRISPTLMEALQVLKFSLKKKRLNFTQGWVTSQTVLVEDEYEETDNKPDRNTLLNLKDAHALDSFMQFVDKEENGACEEVDPLP